jgi:hypothetical protein
LRPREKFLDADGSNKRIAAQTKLLCINRDHLMMADYRAVSAAFPGARRAPFADRGRPAARGGRPARAPLGANRRKSAVSGAPRRFGRETFLFRKFHTNVMRQSKNCGGPPVWCGPSDGENHTGEIG